MYAAWRKRSPAVRKRVLVHSGWTDCVCAPDHHPERLRDVATYIDANHRLPGMPSAAEVREQGVGLGDMQAKLLAKAEELTLHWIRLQQDNGELRKELAELVHSAKR